MWRNSCLNNCFDVHLYSNEIEHKLGKYWSDGGKWRGNCTVCFAEKIEISGSEGVNNMHILWSKLLRKSFISDWNVVFFRCSREQQGSREHEWDQLFCGERRNKPMLSPYLLAKSRKETKVWRVNVRPYHENTPECSRQQTTDVNNQKQQELSDRRCWFVA